MSRWSRLLLAVLTILLAPTHASAGERLAVIVHPSRSVRLSTKDLAQIYLKKRRHWPGGDPIFPINRDAESKARAIFSRAVFGSEATHLVNYWNRKYFDGILPPPTLASTEAMRRFVAAEPNAVGYIEAEMVDDSVRVVLYLE